MWCYLVDCVYIWGVIAFSGHCPQVKKRSHTIHNKYTTKYRYRVESAHKSGYTVLYIFTNIIPSNSLATFYAANHLCRSFLLFPGLKNRQAQLYSHSEGIVVVSFCLDGNTREQGGGDSKRQTHISRFESNILFREMKIGWSLWVFIFQFCPIGFFSSSVMGEKSKSCSVISFLFDVFLTKETIYIFVIEQTGSEDTFISSEILSTHTLKKKQQLWMKHILIRHSIEQFPRGCIIYWKFEGEAPILQLTSFNFF